MKKTENKNNSVEKNTSKISMRGCLVKCQKIGAWCKSNRIMVIGILAVMLSFLGGYFIKSLIAATVNGKPIWRAKIVKQLEAYQGASLLDSMIEQELIKQEAKEKGKNVTEQEIADQIKQVEESMGSQGTTLDEALKAQNMTRADLEENFKMNILIEKLLSDRINVTDQEIQTYIDANKDSFGEGADIEQIKTLVKQQLQQQKMSEEFQKLVDELRQKADINVVAKY